MESGVESEKFTFSKNPESGQYMRMPIPNIDEVRAPMAHFSPNSEDLTENFARPLQLEEGKGKINLHVQECLTTGTLLLISTLALQQVLGSLSRCKELHQGIQR